MEEKNYKIDDIVKSYKWLGHVPYGFTELMAFHKDYKLGREHFEENREHKRFPKNWYGKYPSTGIKFVNQFHKDHTVCYGINPRPGILKKESGYNRSATDADIKHVMNFFLDIDFENPNPTDQDIADLEIFLEKTRPFFRDLKLNEPTRAMTGNGYHLLFAIPPVSVEDQPDIKDRLQCFLMKFLHEFYQDLNGLGLKVDNTMDLSRVAKIYGTKKPDGQRMSEFHGGERVEDEALRDMLLSMTIEQKVYHNLSIPDDMPARFAKLLEEDEEIRQLWEGIGKKEGDLSRSGYDFSLVRKCIDRGITDFMELASILSSRRAQELGSGEKSDQYIWRTIANAIKQ